MQGGTPTSTLRLQMQRAMQTYATVFRTGSMLQEGKEALREVWNGLSDISVTDRSMIWNSDLVETLEFENLLLQATSLVEFAIAPTESRGAHAREDFPKRDDQDWMKHTLAWVDQNGAVRLEVALDYPAVDVFELLGRYRRHQRTTDDETDRPPRHERAAINTPILEL